MEDIVREMFVDGLHGRYTHIDPRKTLIGLSAEVARKKPKPELHSCWELLYHMVVWQDFTVRAFNGEDIDWDQAIEIEWLNESDMKNDNDFYDLVEKFNTGFRKMEEFIKTGDLKTPTAAMKDKANIQLAMVVLGHNSYHAGQIVVTRTLLHNWPPDSME
jgi:hypothetical protein